MLLTDEAIIFIENSTNSRSYLVHARAVEAATIAAYEAKLIDQQENVVVIEVVPLNELFQRAIVKHLGPEALLHEKVSPYQIAERFFHAGYAVRHPAPIPEGWQPIDTAPKDGLIDIFCNGRRYAQCHYDAICNEFRHITACGVLVILKKPTHWMPLPKPPMLAARSVE